LRASGISVLPSPATIGWTGIDTLLLLSQQSQTRMASGKEQMPLLRRHETQLLEQRDHIPVVGAAFELVALQFKHTSASH
jgi:hypothetical protein